MDIRLLATKARQRIRKVGLTRFAAELPRRMMRRRPVTDFDARNGTDTESNAPLWKYRISFESAKFGAEYQTPPEADIMGALADLPRDSTLVDLGSGKGRALIVAARMGFRRVIGVEFVAELAEISRRNLRVCKLDAEVVTGDAAAWDPPLGKLCVYLYSPFSIEVMRKVGEKLRNRQDKTWVAYLNPTSSPGCAELFNSIAQRIREKPGLTVWAIPPGPGKSRAAAPRPPEGFEPVTVRRESRERRRW